MINLLDNQEKKALKAARLNVILRGYVILFALVAACIVVIFGVGIWLQMRERDSYIEDSKRYSSEKAQYTQAQATGNAFTGNLTIAKSILNNEVLYSDLITTLARTLPAGSSLDSLSVATADFAKPITLVIRTNSYNTAILTKDAFENSAAFESVNILTTSQTKDSKTKYNFAVTLSVTITKDAFIHGKAAQ